MLYKVTVEPGYLKAELFNRETMEEDTIGEAACVACADFGPRGGGDDSRGLQLLLRVPRARPGRARDRFRPPPFGSPSVKYSLPELTHDGGIIYPIRTPCLGRPEGGPWASGENREVRGHDSYRRGQTRQSALRCGTARGPGASCRGGSERRGSAADRSLRKTRLGDHRHTHLGHGRLPVRPQSALGTELGPAADRVSGRRSHRGGGRGVGNHL